MFPVLKITTDIKHPRPLKQLSIKSKNGLWDYLKPLENYELFT